MDRKIDFKLHTTVPDWWDKIVEENSAVYTSSSKWAKSYEQMGLGRGLYIEILVNDRRSFLVLIYEVLIGGVLLLKLPKFLLSTLSKINFLRSMNMHLQPVVIDEALLEHEEVLVDISFEFFKYLISLANSRGVNIKPADYVLFKNVDSAKTLIKGLRNLHSIGTVRVPLDISIDEKFNSLNKSVKGSIKKAQSLNVQVKEIEAKEFHSELQSSWKSYGLAVNPSKYYKTLSDESKGDVKFYISHVNNIVLAGSAIMYFGSTMSEFSMFGTNYARAQKIPGGDILKWYLIESGIKNGYKFIDLNMIDVSDESDEKTRSINHFKLKWGGYVLYGVTISEINTFISTIRKIKLQILGK